MLRLQTVIVQGLYNLETCQNPECAVKFPAGRLRIEVTACEDWRQRVIVTGAAPKNIAYGVNPEFASSIATPTHEQFAPSLILVG